MNIVIDPEFQSLLMPLTAEEYAQLERNILEEGCREPLLLWQVEPEKNSHKCYYDPAIHGNKRGCSYGDGPCDLYAGDGVWTCHFCDHNPALLEATLIDGHNRYEICTKHGVEFEVEYLDFENRKEAHDWIINNQLGRRNVTPEQASYLRGRRFLSEKSTHGGNRKSIPQNEGLKGETAEKLADIYKVSRATIERDAEYAFAIDTIGLIAGEETKRDILAGNTKLTKQDVIAIQEMEPAKQIKTIEMIQNGEARSMRDAERLTRRAEVAEAADIPTGKYRVIYADPPWKYNDKQTENYGGTQYHYPSMTIAELCEKIPVVEMADDDAVLFLWVTSPLLEECFPLIKAWGFKYKASFVWDKVKHNMGHYNSVRHEFLLVCTRGSCTPDVSKLYDSVQSIERKEHSEKPEEFREIIDTIYPHGARLELFARKQTEGWEVYGNQFKGAGL